MKLIVDMPEDTIDNVKNYGTFLNPKDQEILRKAFRNSQPFNGVIDKIRTEIEEEEKVENIPEDVNMWHYTRALDRALSIIDRYKAEKEAFDEKSNNFLH